MGSHYLGTGLRGKREKPSLQRIHTCENVVLEDALQYSAHTIIHVGKSRKTFGRLRMVSGYLSFQQWVVCLSGPVELSLCLAAEKHCQVCSEQPQNHS